MAVSIFKESSVSLAMSCALILYICRSVIAVSLFGSEYFPWCYMVPKYSVFSGVATSCAGIFNIWWSGTKGGRLCPCIQIQNTNIYIEGNINIIEERGEKMQNQTKKKWYTKVIFISWDETNYASVWQLLSSLLFSGLILHSIPSQRVVNKCQPSIQHRGHSKVKPN